MKPEPEVIANFGDNHNIEGRFSEDDGLMKLRALTIAANPGHEVTSEVLRAVEIPKLVNAAREAIARSAHSFTPEYLDEFEAEHGIRPQQSWDAETVAFARRRIKAASARAARSGRPTLGDEHYRWVALRYIELIEAQKARGILTQIARDAEPRLRRPVQIDTVKTWVTKAREKGFLTPGEKGRASGAAGPHLYQARGGKR